MDVFYLENINLKVTINIKGAEVARILSKENGREYLWNGNPEFWGRTSPVLFPIVGSLKDKKLNIDGKEYPMSQHGFARDMDFKMVKQNGKEITFRLDSNEETKKLYPYDFTLFITYQLKGRTLTTTWKVENTGDSDMHFQIGGHPAFMCPLKGKGEQTSYYISFDTDKDIEYSLINSNGLVEFEGNKLETEDGVIKIDKNMFDKDALIIEGNQAHRVSLLGPDKMAYLTVSFDAPLFGLWSPAGKNAPFICIEPWYGRADKESFSGDIKEREYDNKLSAGEVFETSYTVEVE